MWNIGCIRSDYKEYKPNIFIDMCTSYDSEHLTLQHYCSQYTLERGVVRAWRIFWIRQ